MPRAHGVGCCPFRAAAAKENQNADRLRRACRQPRGSSGATAQASPQGVGRLATVLLEPAAASNALGQPKTQPSSPNANGPRGPSRWSAPARRPPHAWHRAARLMHRFATVLTREKASARQRSLIAARGSLDASEGQRGIVARPRRLRRERRKLLAVALRAWELAPAATIVAPNRENSPCRSKGWTTSRS
jgi:hypothetical protein